MKIYISSRDQGAGRKLRWLLAEAGYDVASRWLDIDDYVSLPDEEVARRAAATNDIQDVRDSDILLLRAEPDGAFVPGGKHVETGIALALGKPVVVLGRPENVFHWHPLVSVVSDERVLIERLDQLTIICQGARVTTPGEAKVDDLTKIQFDYAWKWFDLHAKQRTTIFNYFMVIVGILANALVTAYKEGYQTFVIPIALLGAATSVAFVVFDIRNRQLVGQAEDVLEKLEESQIYPAAFQGESGKRLGFMVVERESKMREGQHRDLWKSFLKHKWWIRSLETAVGLCFLAALFLQPHGVQQNQVSKIQEQLQRVENSLHSSPNRSDVQSLRDDLARIELTSRDSVRTAELRSLSDQLSDLRAASLKMIQGFEAMEQRLSSVTPPHKPASNDKH